MLRRQLPAAIGMLIIFTVLTGVVYPLVVTAIGQTRLQRQGRGLARRGRRRGRRLVADRPAVHRPRVLPPAARRRRATGTTPPPARDPTLARPTPTSSPRSRNASPPTATRTACGRHPRARRCRHRLGLRSRPAHLGRQRRAAGATRRRGSRARHRRRARTRRRAHDRAAISGSSARRASTCSS